VDYITKPLPRSDTSFEADESIEPEFRS